MKIFVQLWWFFRREWKRYFGAVILLIINAILQLIPPKLVEIIIDGILVHKNLFIKRSLILLIVEMFSISVLIYWFRFIWRILLFGTAYKLAVDLRDQIYFFLSKQSSEFYLQFKTGDLITRVTSDVDKVVFAAGEGVLTLVDSLVVGCSVLLTMIVKISWKLTIFSILPLPFMVWFVKINGHYLYCRFQTAQVAYSSLNSKIQEILVNIRMIKSFGLEKYQLNYFFSAVTNSEEQDMNVAKVDSKFNPVIYLTVSLTNLLTIIFGHWLVINSFLTIGQLISFIMYLGLMIWPMLAIAWMFNIVERGSAAYSRIQQTIKKNKIILDGNLSLPKERGILDIKIRTFYYPNTQTKSLQDIFIMLSPGEMLGVCGPTGSGKSTLLALIMRDFDINDGEIRFHNLSLTEFSLDKWRSRLAIVNQIPFVFSDSIFNNIAFGNQYATFQQVEKVTKLVYLNEDIQFFPDGYYTKIGKNGVMLSGGQKQRLAIARALLMESEFLILDDALSAIDENMAFNILRNMQVSNFHRCTVIITANRLSILKNAKEIVVLQEGKIIQRGNHFELKSQPGWYNNTYYYQQLEKSL